MGTPRLTLRQLQIFRVVAETGSTAAAAGTISLSQSATSAAINELERLLELQLFDPDDIMVHRDLATAVIPPLPGIR